MLPLLNKIELLERILERCKRDSNGCLIFRGALNSDNGYGIIRVAGKNYTTHRLIYHLVSGMNLNSSLYILHKDDICKSKSCCEFDHLYAGNQFENVNEAIDSGKFIKNISGGEIFRLANERKKLDTHCKWGHEFTKANTYTYYGKRACRQCNIERSKKARSKKRPR